MKVVMLAGDVRDLEQAACNWSLTVMLLRNGRLIANDNMLFFV